MISSRVPNHDIYKKKLFVMHINESFISYGQFLYSDKLYYLTDMGNKK